MILIYSNQIFSEMHDGGSKITPRTGVYITGIVNMLASLLSTQTVRWFGRRTLLIAGHFGIFVAHLMVAIFDIQGNNDGVVVMVMVFLFIYQNSSGPVAWLYAAETVVDAALGMCLFTLWGTVFILSLVCPVLMGPTSIGASNVFFIFSGLSIGGTLYSYLVIRETQGLSDKEKKEIFTPAKFKAAQAVTS